MGENKTMSKEIATLAGGCFWCMLEPFDERPGIESVVSGYTGGFKENPTYEEVKAGGTGHTEAIQITFDNSVISYGELLDIYWQQTDPTDAMGQFMDRGSSYRPEIFYHSEIQKEIAERSKEELKDKLAIAATIVTQISPASIFYPAEEYHQDFYKKEGNHERMIPLEEDRQNRLNEVWGEADKHEKNI